MNMPKPDEKPFAIPKLLVWEAWRQVKANKGAPGVDGQALDEFEADLADNLYKIWNRMSSGTYVPAAGQGGRDPQAAWRWGPNAGRADGHLIPLRRPTSLWVRWWSRIGSIRFMASGLRFCMCVGSRLVACMCVMAVGGGTSRWMRRRPIAVRSPPSGR